MRLRGLLNTLGLQPDGPAPGAGAFLHRLQDQLRLLGPDRLEYLAGFAGQLARVAHVDGGISAEEAVLIGDLLGRQAKLSAPQARVVVDLLRHEFGVLRSVEHHLLNRAINAHASTQDKHTLLDCLYAVASVDRTVSEIEEREIRKIAEALLVPHRVLMEIRAAYRDHLEVFQLLKRARQGA